MHGMHCCAMPWSEPTSSLFVTISYCVFGLEAQVCSQWCSERLQLGECDSTSATATFVAPLVPRLGPTGKHQNDWQSAAVGKISILCVGTVAVAALRPTLGNDTVGSTANRGLTSCAGFACILSCACGTRHAVMTAYSHHAELVWLKPAC